MAPAPCAATVWRIRIPTNCNYYNLHQKVADDARIVPILFYGYSIYAERGLLSDLEPARDNVFFYSLNKTMESIRIPTDYS